MLASKRVKEQSPGTGTGLFSACGHGRPLTVKVQVISRRRPAAGGPGGEHGSGGSSTSEGHQPVSGQAAALRPIFCAVTLLLSGQRILASVNCGSRVQ